MSTKINWNDYVYLSHKDGFLIFKHKEEKGKPKYAYRGERTMVKGETGTTDSFADIKILIDEYIGIHFSNGIASGYRITSYPLPDQVYRNVAIGKYLYRDEAVNLPKFIAIIRPYNNMDGWNWSEISTVKIEENTVAHMKKRIDHAISELPKKYAKFFTQPKK